MDRIHPALFTLSPFDSLPDQRNRPVSSEDCYRACSVYPMTPPETGYSTPLPFVLPRKTPSIDPHPLILDLGDGPIPRSPTTPPLLHPTPTIAQKQRSRSCTAPSLIRRSTYPTYTVQSSFPVCPPSPDLEATVLGLTRTVSEYHPHHGDRIREILSGDGEFDIDDAVTPEHLPEHARPIIGHRRHLSASALPPLLNHQNNHHDGHSQALPAVQEHGQIQYIPTAPYEDDIDCNNSTVPRSQCKRLCTAERYAPTPHSPLSTCVPRSHHAGDLLDRRYGGRREWVESSETGMTEHIEDVEDLRMQSPW